MAYTEFYCDAATGDNLNAGTGGTNDYTTAGGNWTNATRVFTVTDGTNPSSKIAVGDFCSVYVTSGATIATFVGRVTAVQNATNGTVTLNAASGFMGTNPSNGTGTMTLKHGGTWKGPNAGVTFPFSQTGVNQIVNTNSDPVRINMKNGTDYSISTGISTSAAMNGVTVQGYASSVGDGGKAVIDGGTNVITVWTEAGNDTSLIDLEIKCAATTGTGSGLIFSQSGSKAIRVVSHGHRNVGLGSTGGGTPTFIECEAYSNNGANGSNSGGFYLGGSNGGAKLLRCYSHDNTKNGFVIDTTGGIGISFISCIADSNSGVGFNRLATANLHNDSYINCDAYNNGSDGIKLAPSGFTTTWIENCNFIKNTGNGINNTESSTNYVNGFVYNCGYGSGTQANGGGDATLGRLVESGKVTYASGITPWVAPTTGNFTVNLAAAMNAGRAHWEENDGTNTGTVGYPDIGASQHRDTQKSSTFGG